jgi:methyl-accepting chemotaxis protein
MLLKTRVRITGVILGAGFLITVCIGVFTIEKVRVGGPMYGQIVLVKDLVADILPPPEYVLEAYLETTLALNDSTQVKERSANLVKLHNDYDERRAYWQAAEIPADLKAKLTEVSDAEVARFWKAVEGGVLPALEHGDRAAAETAYKEASAAYTAHRAIIDQVVTMSNDLNDRTEAETASVRNRLITILAAGVGILLLLLIGVVAGASRIVVRPIVWLTDVMEQLSKGRLDVAVEDPRRNDELGAMIRALQVFKANAVALQESIAAKQRKDEEDARQFSLYSEKQAAKAKEIAFVVESLGSGLDQLAEGKLTYRLTQAFPDEYRKLQVDFNAAITELQSVMGDIVGSIDEIHASARQITTAADDLARRSEQQAASLEETAASLDEITSTVKETASGVRNANEVAAGAKTDAEASGTVVRQAIDAIDQIEKSSRQIGQIIGVIDEIAFQTNLLALNAGVEAARAGDAGRGFAVVASEVRALAQRAAAAAKEIKDLISTSSSLVASGVDLVRATGSTLERIMSKVIKINDLAAQVSGATHEQSTTLAAVNKAIAQMDQNTQQNAAMVEESTAASHSLAQQAEALAQRVARFDIGESSSQSSERRAA